MRKIKSAQLDENEFAAWPQPTDFSDVEVRRLHGTFSNLQHYAGQAVAKLDQARENIDNPNEPNGSMMYQEALQLLEKEITGLRNYGWRGI